MFPNKSPRAKIDRRFHISCLSNASQVLAATVNKKYFDVCFNLQEGSGTPIN
jgi:hypothetical protein